MAAFPAKRVHHFASVVSGGTPKNDDSLWDGDIPFITPPDLNGLDGKSVEDTRRVLTEKGVTSGSSLVESGVIFSCRAPVGHVGRVVEPSAFNQGCKVLVSHENDRFLAYALIAHRSLLSSLANGTTFMEVSSSAVANMKLPLPDLDTQRRIADYLDKETAQIDTLVKELDEYVELLEKRKIIFKRNLFSQYPGEMLQLNRLGTMKTGTTPKSIELDESGVQWLKPEGLARESTGAKLNKNLISDSGLLPAAATYVCGIGATVGKVGFCSVEATSNQQITGIVPNSLVRPLMLYHLVSDITEELRQTAPGSTLPILNNIRLGSYKVKVPEIHVQDEILTKIECESSRINTLIKECRELKEILLKRRQVLITDVVTGKVEV